MYVTLSTIIISDHTYVQSILMTIYTFALPRAQFEGCHSGALIHNVNAVESLFTGEGSTSTLYSVIAIWKVGFVYAIDSHR